MTRIATVASIATGPLRNVLNITAKLITSSIVSQIVPSEMQMLNTTMGVNPSPNTL